MSKLLQYTTPLTREDVHGEIRVVADYDLLQRGSDYEAETKLVNRENRKINAWLACFLIIGGAFLLWLPIHFGLWAEVWSDCVWLWNSGGDQPWDGPARWGILTGVACVIWALGVGLYERMTKGRE